MFKPKQQITVKTATDFERIRGEKTAMKKESSSF